jgi:DNA-binding beta-propeller fold protein YncE
MKQLLTSFCLILIFFNGFSQNKIDTNIDKTANETKLIGNIFPQNAQWFNTDLPLTADQLKGKIVLLHFFNASNVGCIKAQTDIKKLKANFRSDLEVVYVNSPYFTADRDNEALLNALLKNNIDFPAVNDVDLEISKKYTIEKLPTTLIISENGETIKEMKGDKLYSTLNPLIAEWIAKHTDKINHSEFYYKSEKSKEKNTILRYPSKIEADEDNNYLFVSDAGNNRILIMDEYGSVINCIGSSIEGNTDGDFSFCSFNNPQGIAFDKRDNVLYVADQNNHSIRKVDLNLKTVSTFLEKNKDINLPYELIYKNDFLYISNRGSGKIIKVKIGDASAGQLFESVLPKDKFNATDFDPTGIALDSLGGFYFADASNSKVKRFDLNTKEITNYGAPDSLFGDADGKYNVAMFQYPLGVSFLQANIFIIDTYNNKIRQVGKSKIITFLGVSNAGNKNGSNYDASFNHPSDITWLNGKYYITDTYNHLIRVYDPEKQTVRSLVLSDYENMNRVMMQKNVGLYILDTLYLPNAKQKIAIKLNLDNKFIFNKAANNEIFVTPETDEVLLEATDFPSGVFAINTNLKSENALAQINCILYCQDSQRADLAFYKEVVLMIPMVIQSGAKSINEIIFQVPE